jgi:amidohydrolase
MPTNDLLAAAHEVQPYVVENRRAIHRHPELAYQEEQTASLVTQRLKELGMDLQTGVAGTGVIGLIEGKSPGKTVLLRADMDALPLQEKAEIEFRSEVDGVMHACGHDSHTAMLLGAAKLLHERKDGFSGQVKLMFQPAEEGGAGAMRMIEAGLLDNPSVDAAFALHVSSSFWAKEVAVKAGPTHASSDRFTIRVKARGGHAARPHLTVDPVVVAAHIVTALQTLVSREVSPTNEAVVTIGQLEAGTTFNIISDEAFMRGTVRTYSPEVQAHIEKRLPEIAKGIAQAMRAEAEVDYFRMYPVVINHEWGAELVRRAGNQVLGEGQVLEDEAQMGGEDFSFLMQRVPGAMFKLGIRRPGSTPFSLHTSDFDLDESALPYGTAMMAGSALQYLSEE